MIKMKLKFGIIILLVLLFFYSGCLSKIKTGNETENTSIKVTPSITTQNMCPSIANTTPYVLINPIGSHFVGDFFEINGTTNIRENNMILVQIYQSHFARTPRNISYEYTSLLKNVTIQGNHCGINSWSLMANISSFNPEEYFVEVTSINPTAANRSVFEVLNKTPSEIRRITTAASPVIQRMSQ